ncbi:hypothetical protein [Burkholderia glumae]|uniref:Uncharacterized protein n=1 Tax=Burkholderia glumae TaxID=337 RepID=A0AAP9Y6H7_BURGL|nr:hypothetical protein [Burkholderia glumae]AJY62341.1 hypothetical protein KS03_5800 [Burkholderia glumae LMG 2196 = ATCC 33617]AJY62516.1 hypothetical protein KS03_5660 [Burkholderia glumae LMG 2196 = ATCC 33617]MCM2485622.1 hypothetical protein [Burkholderia glumae]MCM2511510.1 hypothetical protein [Burkholderia glumae]MCM2541717.1 hypothetical protein [Burkholderia glumae]
MSAVPSGHARDRRSRFGLRAVVAIQRRFKRQLVVLLLLLVSGCTASARPAPLADESPERIARDAARRAAAGPVQSVSDYLT